MPTQFTNLLDVAIVLAALYIALSTISSFINEQIATFLRLRGKKLFLGVVNLVTSESLANAIFAHPAIDTTVNDKAGIRNLPNQPNRPNYVEPHNFAVAFWDELADFVTATFPPPARAAKALADATAAAAINPTAAPRIQAATELVAQRAAAVPPTGTGVLSDGAHFEDLRQVVESLPIGQLKTNALQLLALSESDYSKLLKSTEDWFNRQMAAVEGWYTRQARYIAIVLAAVVVFATGLDTFEIAQRLYTAPATVSAAAKSIIDANTNAAANKGQTAVANAANALLKGNDFRDFFHPCLGLPIGAPCFLGRNDTNASEPHVSGIDPKTLTCSPDAAKNPKDTNAKMCLRDVNRARDQAQLDMALTADSEAKQTVLDDRADLLSTDSDLRSAKQQADKKKIQDDEQKLKTLLTKVNTDVATAKTASDTVTAAQQSIAAYAPLQSHVVGWIVTFLAISLGAPFWFDVANKIVNVRNAGQKPPVQTSS